MNDGGEIGRFETVTLSISMPLDQLIEKVAQLTLLGVKRAHLPYVRDEKASVDDFKKVAAFVVGGLVGVDRGLEKPN